MATTSTGAKAGVLVVDGCARTGGGEQNVSQVSGKEPRAKGKERVAPTMAKGPGLLATGAEPSRSRCLYSPSTHRLKEGATAPSS